MKGWNRDRSNKIAEMQLMRQIAITEATTDLVATMDIDGFLQHLNPAGYDLLGLPRDSDISQLRLVSFYQSDSAKAFLKNEISRALVKGAWHSEVTIVTSSEEEIPCSQVLIAHKDNVGNVEFFSVILRNIKSIKDAESERGLLIDELHQSKKMETVGRLAGGIAHDFNNLITVIMGNAELAILSAQDGEPCLEELSIILDSANKAARLTNQLLDYSRKKVIEPHKLDINKVLAESEQLISSLMGEEIEIRLDKKSELWPIKMDRSQLEQVFMNLSVNARDAMDSHGLFEIETDNISVNSQNNHLYDKVPEGEYVRLIFRDSGCGIPEKNIEHIFDPFFTTKSRGKGTGMGLSAVYGAITQNCGHIRVKSKEAKGTEFDLYIPRALEEEDYVIEDFSLCEASELKGSETILLVEDNLSVLNLLTAVLEGLGYQVITASDGVQALDAYYAAPGEVDLVVSDVLMPNKNGLELYHDLVTINPQIRVLLISGHTDQVVTIKDLERENLSLLSKPFPSRKFAEEIRTCLGSPCLLNPMAAAERH